MKKKSFVPRQVLSTACVIFVCPLLLFLERRRRSYAILANIRCTVKVLYFSWGFSLEFYHGRSRNISVSSATRRSARLTSASCFCKNYHAPQFGGKHEAPIPIRVDRRTDVDNVDMDGLDERSFARWYSRRFSDRENVYVCTRTRDVTREEITTRS